VICRKKNAKSEVIETLYECSQEDSEAGKKACVLKEEHIHLISHSDLYWAVTQRGTASVCQTDSEQKQKSCSHTIGDFLGEAGIYDKKNKTAINQSINRLKTG
jgi:hypothetical protein